MERTRIVQQQQQHAGDRSPRATRPRALPLTLNGTISGGGGAKSPLRHVSPRKFHEIQQQQQRAAGLRAMPLSPLTARVDSGERKPRRADSALPAVYEPRESVPWNPAWLPEASPYADAANAQAVDALLRAAGAMGTSPTTTLGSMTLDEWLQRYEHEFLVYESLEKFVQVKLPEALAFCDKLERQSRPSTSAAASSGSNGTGPAKPALPTSRFHVRLRIAVYAHLVERTVFALAQSPSLAHAKRTLFETRQELFRAMFADYDAKTSASEQRSGRDDGSDRDDGNDSSGSESGSPHHRERRHPRRSGANTDANVSGDSSSERDSDASDRDASARPRSKKKTAATAHAKRFASSRYGPTAAPRTLAFFLTKVPFALKLREDTQRRALRFKRHQVVLRRIVQSLYQSLGSVFHAWKLLVRQKKEERLNTKGAQLTAMVVQQRGLVRSVFVEWSKATLRARVHALQFDARELKQQHEHTLADLRREVFLLRETNRALQLELAETQRFRPVARKPKPPAAKSLTIPASSSPIESAVVPLDVGTSNSTDTPALDKVAQEPSVSEQTYLQSELPTPNRSSTASSLDTVAASRDVQADTRGASEAVTSRASDLTQ